MRPRANQRSEIVFLGGLTAFPFFCVCSAIILLPSSLSLFLFPQRVEH